MLTFFSFLYESGYERQLASRRYCGPCDTGPAIYNFNLPRYFVILLRAREFAKKHGLQITWSFARDIPLFREDRDLPTHQLNLKRAKWLERHDQDTAQCPRMILTKPVSCGKSLRPTRSARSTTNLRVWQCDIHVQHLTSNATCALRDESPQLFQKASFTIGTRGNIAALVA